MEGGQEHRVLEDAASQRYYKITHPDQFGLYPEPTSVLDKTTQKFVPRFLLRKALPFEYLSRLHAQNDIFGDDHQLHGVFVDNAQLRTVISQSALKGKPPAKQEIYDTMAENGFEVVRSGGSQFFYRDTDDTAVFDGHEGNFLKTGQGVLPIDVIAVHPQGKLMEAIREARGQGSRDAPPPTGPPTLDTRASPG